MLEIVSGIFTWPWYSERHGYNFNGYLLRLPETTICVDPVEPDAETLQQIGAQKVAHIIITNRNHTRAANIIRTRTGARTSIHRADAAYAQQQGAELDEHLDTADHVGQLVVVAVPGKSPGEIALHWPARRILLVGDAVIGNPPGHCSLLPEKVIDDPALLRASVNRLLDLDFDTLLVGDGTPIVGGAKERLAALAHSWAV